LAFLDRQAFAGETIDRDRAMGNTFLLQHMPDHFAGWPADGEDRDRIPAQRVDRSRDVDPAAARIIARRVHAAGD
jgi:hypothetical protein